MLQNAFTVAMMTMLSLGIAPLAQADLILDLASVGAPHQCGGCGSEGTVWGWEFTVNNPITVDGIGVWDYFPTPFSATQAGLWTSGGDLLGSATITASSTPVASAAGTGGPWSGQWLFENIDPVTLAPGDYVTGSVFYDTTPLAALCCAFVNIPEITADGGVVGTFVGGFTPPLEDDPLFIFGATLDTVAPISEPGSAALLGLCFAALLLWRNRCRRCAGDPKPIP
jgi:hypothetical protein